MDNFEVFMIENYKKRAAELDLTLQEYLLFCILTRLES